MEDVRAYQVIESVELTEEGIVVYAREWTYDDEGHAQCGDRYVATVLATTQGDGEVE